MLGEEEEMSSDCSSGCQSGWTMYLEQSSYESPGDLVCKKGGGSFQQEEEQEEEDLSMVSDASSGPPHFHGEDEHCYCFQQCGTHCCHGNGCLCSALTPAAAAAAAALAKDGGKKRRVEEAEKQDQHSSLLDDTASSPLLIYSQANSSENKSYMMPSVDGVMEFSCGFSATHFKEKSALQKQMAYLQASVPKKQTPRPVSRKDGGKRMW